MGLGVRAGSGQGSGEDNRMTNLSNSHRSESQGQDPAATPLASVTIHSVHGDFTLRTGERSWKRARGLLKRVVRVMLMRDDSGLKGGEGSIWQRGWVRTTRGPAQRWRWGERPSLESGQAMFRSQASDRRPIHNSPKPLLKSESVSCPVVSNSLRPHGL